MQALQDNRQKAFGKSIVQGTAVVSSITNLSGGAVSPKPGIRGHSSAGGTGKKVCCADRAYGRQRRDGGDVSDLLQYIETRSISRDTKAGVEGTSKSQGEGG